MLKKQQLLKQQIPQYQHQDGTCYCGICLCGKCNCQPKPQQTIFTQKLSSTYEKDFDASRIAQKPVTLPKTQYQGRQKALSLHSVYNEDFDKKQIEILPPELTKTKPERLNNITGIPFNGYNSYAIQYPAKHYQPPDLLKPLNQIQLLPGQIEKHSLYQRTHNYKRPDSSKIPNFSKIMNQRLHINSQEKNIYLNSSYQEQFKGKIQKRVERLPIQESYLPFGLSNNGINPYVSVNRQDYYNKNISQCEADKKIQELCQQLSQQ